MMNWSFLLLVAFYSFYTVNCDKAKNMNMEDIGDDYSDFSSQAVKNGGAHHELKAVTYSTIAPKLDIPTRPPQLLNSSPKTKSKPMNKAPPPAPQYNRGYYFQHYPWDRLPRRYLMRPGMTYVYPTQYQFAQYRYPYLDQTDPYNIYRSHPGIGGGCGGGYGSSGCGGGGGYGGYGGGYATSGGCGNGGGGGCSDDGSSEEFDDSYEDEEGGKSGESKINKKDPLEDLELEDLEKLSKSSDDNKSSETKSSHREESSSSKTSKSSKDDKDYDLIDDRKKFLVNWA